jgi:hypothetical protein
MKLLCFLIYALKETTPGYVKLTKSERRIFMMKKLTLVLCMVCLLVPTITMANQPCPLCLNLMLEEGIVGEEELESILSGDWDEDDVRAWMAEAEGINPSGYVNYWCYYLAYLAISDFLDCLVYGYDYDCRGALVYALVYYYSCT